MKTFKTWMGFLRMKFNILQSEIDEEYQFLLLSMIWFQSSNLKQPPSDFMWRKTQSSQKSSIFECLKMKMLIFFLKKILHSLDFKQFQNHDVLYNADFDEMKNAGATIIAAQKYWSV